MIRKRQIGSKITTLVLLASFVLPESGLTDALRYLAFGYMSMDLVLQARSGYLRRRPHWTGDSWRRYLRACAVPVGAFAVMASMIAAVEWRLPIVGAARSTVRAVWGGGTVVVMIIGVFGLGSALDWLNRDDPARPFEGPRWLRFGRGKTV